MMAAISVAATSCFGQGTTPLQGRHAAMAVKVPVFLDAEKHILEWAAQNGLEVVSKDGSSTEKGRRHGWIKLHMPAEKYEPTLAELGSLGKIVTTKRWVDDLESRKRELTDRQELVIAHGARLNSLLSGRNLRVRDKLYIYDLLYQNRVSQDSLNQQLGKIEAHARTASVTLTMFEPYLATETPTTAMGPRKKLAALGPQIAGVAADALGWFAETVVKVLIYSPLWLPVILIGRKWLRRHLVTEPTKT